MCAALRTRKFDVLNACDPRLVFEELPSLAHDVRMQVSGVKGNWTQFYALLSRSSIKLKVRRSCHPVRPLALRNI